LSINSCIEDVAAKKVIEGPSLVVDHILKLNSKATINDLVNGFDCSVAERAASPLFLRLNDSLASRAVYSSGRVGLTLKKATDNLERRKQYILMPYRYLVTPERITKGRNYIVCAMLADGRSVAEVSKLSGVAAHVVSGYVEAFKQGEKKSVEEFKEMELKPTDICALYGAWTVAYKKK
jgi:hypothetical protein